MLIFVRAEGLVVVSVSDRDRLNEITVRYILYSRKTRAKCFTKRISVEHQNSTLRAPYRTQVETDT